MTEWNPDVPMYGTLPLNWSVTMNEEGEPLVLISPYTHDPGDEMDTSSGTYMTLDESIREFDDIHCVAAGRVMLRMAFNAWILPAVSARIGQALIEQRERQGGYTPPEGVEDGTYESGEDLGGEPLGG